MLDFIHHRSVVSEMDYEDRDFDLEDDLADDDFDETLESGGADDEDEEDSAAMMNVFAKEGFLHKQGGLNSAWQRRWFAFKDGALKYYKSMGDEKERGQIPLEDLHVTEVPEDKYKRTLCFEVSSPSMNRVYVLHADTQAELQEWMKAITAASKHMEIKQNKRRAAAAASKQSDKLKQQRARFVLPDEFRLNAGLSLKASHWRQGTSLTGLTSNLAGTSSAAQLGLQTLPIEDRLESTTCGATHNSLPSLAIASNQGRSSVVQIIRLPDPPRTMASASSTISSLHTMSSSISASSTSSSMRVLQRFRQLEGVVSLSWLDDKLLVGSAQGSVHLYRCPLSANPSSSSSSSSSSLSSSAAPAKSNVSMAGLSDNVLEQSYVHAHLRSGAEIQGQQPPPGQWVFSSRIHRVALNPVSKAAFFSLENSTAHLWALDQSARPLHSEKASSGVLFGGCWNPHSGTELMLGGMRRHLKLYDVRLLGQASANKSPVVWKVNDAHDDVIRDIAWSPLMPHWLASAGDDGCVQIYDLRFGAKALMTLQCSNALHSVSWSNSHAESLVSGGVDRRLRLWNLRLGGPHHLVDTHQASFSEAVMSTAYSSCQPHQYLGVSGAGEVACINMGPDFLDTLCQHRFGSDSSSSSSSSSTSKTLSSSSSSSSSSPANSAAANDEFKFERRIENLLYRRDFDQAYALIAQTTASYWEKDQTEAVAHLLKLASSGLFVAATEDTAPTKSFNKLVRDVAYYIPPRAVKLTEPRASANQEIQLFKLRIALIKLMEAEKYQDILSLENEILLQVERSAERSEQAFSLSTLLRMIQVLLPHDYLRTVNFAYRLAELFSKQNRFSDFVSIAHLLFYPTIYHDTVQPLAASSMIQASSQLSATPSGAGPASAAGGATGGGGDGGGVGDDPSAPTAEVQLAQKAQLILERDLRNPKVVLAQLEILYDAFDLMQRTTLPSSAAALVELLEPNRKLLPQSLHRMFFNALLAARHYDKFYIFATQLVQTLEGYRFAEQINVMMNEYGLEKLKKFLDDCCVVDRAAPWESSRATAALLTLMNIVANSIVLPRALKQLAPDYLKRFTVLLRQALLEMRDHPDYKPRNGSGARDAAQAAANILDQLGAIQDAKRSASMQFEQQIQTLTQMLQEFRTPR